MDNGLVLRGMQYCSDEKLKKWTKFIRNYKKNWANILKIIKKQV